MKVKKIKYKDILCYEEYYSFDKLLDLEYHLNNFRNYCNKDDPYNEDFLKILDYELWRFV